MSLKVEAGLCDIVRMMQVLIKLGLTQFWLGHASVWMLGLAKFEGYDIG